jgi:hypothetical protein
MQNPRNCNKLSPPPHIRDAIWSAAAGLPLLGLRLGSIVVGIAQLPLFLPRHGTNRRAVARLLLWRLRDRKSESKALALQKKKRPGLTGTLRVHICMIWSDDYDLIGSGAGTGAVSGPAAPPLTSPTLNRTNRRIEIFSPSLAIAWLIISPIVTLSSLM